MPRGISVLVGVAALLVVVLAMRALSGILGPAFLALVLAVAAAPLRPWMQRHGLPGWLGSVLGLATIYAGLAALTVSLMLAVAQFATLLPTYQPQLNRLLDRTVHWLARMGVGKSQINQLMGAFDLGKVVTLAGDVASGAFGVVSSLFFIVTLVLFMVLDVARLPAKLAQLPPDRRPLAEALTSFASGTRKYLVVSTVFGLVVAVFDVGALVWLGVPAALLWGLLSFITNYIPNIGFVVGVVPPAVIGLLEGGPGTMLAVLVSYSLINVAIQSVIQPKIVGDVVGLSATITMLSLVFWAFTLGPVGALMAVPLSLLAKALLVDADPGARWITPLLSGAAPEAGDTGEPPPDRRRRRGRVMRRRRSGERPA